MGGAAVSSLVHLWMRQEVRGTDSDLDLCQPDQSSRCPSREEAQEPIRALHPTASEICRCAATLEEDPRSAPPPPGPGSRTLGSLRPQLDTNLIKSPHAGQAAPAGSGEGLLTLTRLLLLFVSRGVFEQDVEDGYHQHLPDICHGETPGWISTEPRWLFPCLVEERNEKRVCEQND